jgi:hypothetical protein
MPSYDKSLPFYAHCFLPSMSLFSFSSTCISLLADNYVFARCIVYLDTASVLKKLFPDLSIIQMAIMELQHKALTILRYIHATSQYIYNCTVFAEISQVSIK